MGLIISVSSQDTDAHTGWWVVSHSSVTCPSVCADKQSTRMSFWAKGVAQLHLNKREGRTTKEMFPQLGRSCAATVWVQQEQEAQGLSTGRGHPN